jgi:hypothetical protein
MSSQSTTEDVRGIQTCGIGETEREGWIGGGKIRCHGGDLALLVTGYSVNEGIGRQHGGPERRVAKRPSGHVLECAIMYSPLIQIG